MTSGNTFWTDFSVAQREHFKRRLWPFALAALGYFLYYVVALSLVLTSYVTDSRPLVERAERMAEAAAEMLGPNVFIAMVTMGIAGVLSLQGFSWMHNRRMVDFYESHPVGRSRRFAQVCVNSFLIFILSYALSLLIGVLICCGFGIYGKPVAEAVFEGSIKAFALFASTYFIGVLAATLTGNALISVLAMGVLMVYEAVLRFTLQIYVDEFLNTIVMGEQRFYTSPLYYYVTDGVGKPVAAMLILALVCALAAFFCYKIRKNESAGRAVIFQPVRTVVKIAISVVGGLVAWRIFYSSRSMVLSLVFMCFFVMVVGCTMQIIYDSDFKALFRRGWELAIAAVAALAIVIGFKFDILGINKWMPKTAAVKETAVFFSGSYRGDIINEKGKPQDAREYALSNMHLEDTEAVLALAEKGMDYTQNGAEYDLSDESDRVIEFVVEYHMNGGRKAKRRYWLPYTLCEDLMERVTADERFREGIFQVYHDDYIRENISDFEFRYDNGHENASVDGKLRAQEFYQKFREAYLADLSKYSYTLDRSELPIGSLMIDGRTLYRTMYYPVYACFENTVGVLKEAGCFIEKVDFKAVAAELKAEMEKDAVDGSTNVNVYQGYQDYPIPYDMAWYWYNDYLYNVEAITGMFRNVEDELNELGLKSAMG